MTEEPAGLAGVYLSRPICNVRLHQSIIARSLNPYRARQMYRYATRESPLPQRKQETTADCELAVGSELIPVHRARVNQVIQAWQVARVLRVGKILPAPANAWVAGELKVSGIPPTPANAGVAGDIRNDTNWCHCARVIVR